MTLEQMLEELKGLGDLDFYCEVQRAKEVGISSRTLRGILAEYLRGRRDRARTRLEILKSFVEQGENVTPQDLELIVLLHGILLKRIRLTLALARVIARLGGQSLELMKKLAGRTHEQAFIRWLEGLIALTDIEPTLKIPEELGKALIMEVKLWEFMSTLKREVKFWLKENCRRIGEPQSTEDLWLELQRERERSRMLELELAVRTKEGSH